MKKTTSIMFDLLKLEKAVKITQAAQKKNFYRSDQPAASIVEKEK